MSHTPGPWTVGITLDEKYNWPVFRLSRMESRDTQSPEVQANARLIGAAPDLLIGLELLLKLFRLPLEGRRIDDCPLIISADYEDEIEAALNAARSAVIKTRKGEPHNGQGK